MARSGYEIRLDVLRIAKDLADDRWHQEAERRRDALCWKRDQLHIEDDLRPTGDKPTQEDTAEWKLPEDNREDEALRLAKKLYAFVEAKD